MDTQKLQGIFPNAFITNSTLQFCVGNYLIIIYIKPLFTEFTEKGWTTINNFNTIMCTVRVMYTLIDEDFLQFLCPDSDNFFIVINGKKYITEQRANELNNLQGIFYDNVLKLKQELECMRNENVKYKMEYVQKNELYEELQSFKVDKVYTELLLFLPHFQHKCGKFWKAFKQLVECEHIKDVRHLISLITENKNNEYSYMMQHCANIFQDITKCCKKCPNCEYEQDVDYTEIQCCEAVWYDDL